MSKETEEDKEVFEELRERLLDLVSLYGLCVVGVRERPPGKDVVCEIKEETKNV